MQVTTVQYVLWLLGPVLHGLLAAVMVKRKLRREYPIFFSYTVFQVFGISSSFALYHFSYKAYFLLYWIVAALSVLLEFAVIHEIFTHVFRPYEALRDMATMLFRWAGVVLLLVAIVSAASGSNPRLTAVMAAILSLERGIRMMQCGLVLFLFLFSSYVGLSARSHIFGIALGFGIYASVEVIIVSLWTRMAMNSGGGYDLLKSLTYNVAILAWTSYMLRPQPERKRLNHIAQSEKWNFALAGVVHPDSQDAFLPMIEDAVERILSRRQQYDLPPLEPGQDADSARPN